MIYASDGPRMPQHTAAALRARVRRGDECFLSLAGERVAAFRWACARQARLGNLDLVLPLRSDEVCAYEVFTAPAFRGKGVRDPVRHAFVESYRQRGFRALVNYRTPGRKPWARSHQHRVAIIRTLRLGPFRRFWVRTYGPQAAYWRERLKELRWA